ncbi:glycosyl hydrolase 53 family protein [Reichenbachiella sp.]|uniref:glycosyl hydrolase 53 family protein n=1 Tax=Reichenbachiella sp. TaxID=2184521 RepID=UPI003B5CF5E9
MKSKLSAILVVLLFCQCNKDEPNAATETNRNFKLGFTTWSYGPNLEDVIDTYSFIANNGDIYTEHIDNSIPWNAWINDSALPVAFTNEITGRANMKIPDKQLLLSVSLLSLNRDELALDFDGTTPEYTHLDDNHIKDAYFKHVSYLVNAFSPDYLVIAIEVNELRLKSPEKWDSYKKLIHDVKTRIKQSYPDLKISESISLHNLYKEDVSNPQAYIDEISSQINQNDFVAISFYPFLKNLSSKADFQGALDFLHELTDLPIAFVETAHLAEDLVIPNLKVSIEGTENGQKEYLETLIENAHTRDYEFIIWWAHRDFDALWETFPEEVKDLGQVWRDTGLLSETGTERPAFSIWTNSLQH